MTIEVEINETKRILYVRPFKPIEKEKEGQIGFACSLVNKNLLGENDELLVELTYGEIVFAIEINPNNQIYDTIMISRSLNQRLGLSQGCTEKTFYLSPENFKIVSIFIRKIHLGEPFIVLNQSTGIPTYEQNWRTSLIYYMECDISMTPFLSQDVTELTKFFSNHEYPTIRKFFMVYGNYESAACFSLERKIELLQLVNLPQCKYLIAKLHDDLMSQHYDPDKAFEYLQDCGEYLPAQKAILAKYIAASFDENGKLENPEAYALALQTAHNIIALEPNNAEAKTFLERERTYASSIKISEQFQTIIGQPMKSMMFFKTLTKEMHMNMLYDAKTHGDAKDQEKFDQHYGLTIKSPQPQ